MKTLLVLSGPTGVGKTEWSIQIAERLQCPIISADSRQLYKGMTIGTAAPTPEQMRAIKHHFVGVLKPEDYYNASEYEQDALQLIGELHQKHDTVVLTGGSMMYIDAVCDGIDEIPTIDGKLRKEINALYEEKGLSHIRRKLKLLDPDFYNQVDLKNPKRIIHALEICLMTGKPYSSLRKNRRKERPFKIVKIGFMRPRQELYERINKRVDEMIAQGLIDEAKGFYPLRHLNALNTVGYKELFNYFDGDWTKEKAIEKIKQHSRNYARKQMTWFKKDDAMHWIDLSDPSIDVINEVLNRLKNQ